MNTINRLVGAAVLFWLSTAAAAGTDYYIPNPSFTEGADGEVPAGWIEGYGTPKNCVRSTAQYHSAPASMRIGDNFAKATISRLPKNTPITVGGWVKVDIHDYRTQFAVEFASLRPTWKTVGWIDLMTVSGPTPWTYHSKTIIVPDTVDVVLLNVYHKGTALYWLDDIEVTVGGTAALGNFGAPLRISRPAAVPTALVGLNGRLITGALVRRLPAAAAEPSTASLFVLRAESGNQSVRMLNVR